MEKDPYIASARFRTRVPMVSLNQFRTRDPMVSLNQFRTRDPMVSSHSFTKRDDTPIVTDAVFRVSVPSVTFTGFVNSALLNDDPTRIYSAAWYAKHGIKVLRHDRKGVSEREFTVHDFMDILKKRDKRKTT